MRHPFDVGAEPRVPEEAPRGEIDEPRRRFFRSLLGFVGLAGGLAVASEASAKAKFSDWWKGRSFVRRRPGKGPRRPKGPPRATTKAVGEEGGRKPVPGRVVRPLPPAARKKAAPPPAKP